MDDYDQEVEKIEAYNQPILEGFGVWLEKSGLATKTVNRHCENVDFFAEYLTYDEPLSTLDEADSEDVYMFLMSWFPRKAMWASEAYTKSYMTTFRKFFAYLSESKRIEQEITDQVKSTLKQNKEAFLEAVAFDDDYEW